MVNGSFTDQCEIITSMKKNMAEKILDVCPEKVKQGKGDQVKKENVRDFSVQGAVILRTYSNPILDEGSPTSIGCILNANEKQFVMH